MRRIISMALAAAAFLVSGLAAQAEDYKVAANKTSGLTFMYVYSEINCAFGSKPTFKVLTEPKHGKIFSKWMKLNLTDAPKNCKGRPVYGTAIFYTPNKGYRGEDYARVGIGKTEIPMTRIYNSRSMSINITVE
ncbi:hypothetical protein M2360_002130 [Rhizobium sp. SG_E_25_P2]|uniref:hypothetical protein n=1 Tax=Rhizobium sp. SG_E_25_P2 TaxID=2879942 RepID=UPI002473367C|nr:hypothetical protein [Rhizobium sp. SG_E_25_P2]MDH6266734.1 hypothetical protein [Rhizobium sp. SG_E_25_P2]